MGKVLNKYLEGEGIAQMRTWVIEHGIRKEYKKGDYFIREGEPCHHVGYIESGSFRYTKWNYKGQEQIVGYSFEHDFVTQYGAFQNDTPSPSSAQAIKDCIVWKVDKQTFNQFFEVCGIDGLRYRLDELFFADIYERLLSLYTESPEERYKRLISDFPEILNLVTLKEIASFICITPETLSRIRKKISQGEEQQTTKH